MSRAPIVRRHVFDDAALRGLERWILERDRIRFRRATGQPKPWTKDPIMQQYRFCNVYREYDTVTVWIANNWRRKVRDNWFAMAVARLLNWPDTLRLVGYPVPWKPERFLRAVAQQEADGRKAWGGAYIVSTNGHAMPKPQYVVEHVLNPLWAARAVVRPRRSDTLAAFAARLQQHNGFAGFMAGQVVADAKFSEAGLRFADDWWTWAVSGPGSRRGLNRVCGYPVEQGWKEEAWLSALQELSALMDHRLGMMMDSHLRHAALPERISAQDLQNCLCEFDKYERVRLGEGRPRATYPGTGQGE